MKHLIFCLCLLLGAASCGTQNETPAESSPKVDANERAISDYIKKKTDDPSSYAPGVFRKIGPFMRSDSANLAGMALMKSNIRTVREQGYALIDGPGKDSTTLIGTQFMHSFRAKNRVGGLVLDSAVFIVYKSGQVGAYGLN